MYWRGEALQSVLRGVLGTKAHKMLMSTIITINLHLVSDANLLRRVSCAYRGCRLEMPRDAAMAPVINGRMALPA